MKYRQFTSESVTEGHPDKVCDAISDSILDAILASDPQAHVACETLTTTGMVLVTGEITTSCYTDIPAIVRNTVHEIGYDDAAMGFDYRTCAVMTCIDEQSPDIALGVNASVEAKGASEDLFDSTGAGDQGMVFGFACTQTDELMPAPIYYSHKLTQRLAQVRKDRTLPFVWPDGKAQVSIEYADDRSVRSIPSVVVSTQHSGDVSIETVREGVMEEVVKKVLPAHLLTADTKVYINPTGRFVVGGPHGDSGLTGRKIIVDTYGGYARHGGGAFSGKDPTKVDRSASYMARYVAKNLVAAGLATEAEVAIAYAIGVAHPVMVAVDTSGTGVISDDRLTALVRECFDLRPAAIIAQFDLRRPIYRPTASYGHFGRPELNLPWEKTDKVELLKSKAL
ncbi:MAG: methionine adenosyltransferase [Eubacteriales bacterium]|nr:methionine adenosyltransferase [Eubacteriales bacterium]MDY5346540.1 methionine adenosyltransferase [Eubacteriales bacterium]